MHKAVVSIVAGVLMLASCAQPQVAQSPRDVVFRKNYPLTYALEQNPSLVQEDSVLKALALQKYNALAGAGDSMEAVEMCRFTEEEMEFSAHRLGELAGNLSALVKELKAQGCYSIFNDLPDADFLWSAWVQDAMGMNHVLDVHALGKTRLPPNLPGADAHPALHPGHPPQRPRGRVLSPSHSRPSGPAGPPGSVIYSLPRI